MRTPAFGELLVHVRSYDAPAESTSVCGKQVLVVAKFMDEVTCPECLALCRPPVPPPGPLYVHTVGGFAPGQGAFAACDGVVTPFVDDRPSRVTCPKCLSLMAEEVLASPSSSPQDLASGPATGRSEAGEIGIADPSGSFGQEGENG